MAGVIGPVKPLKLILQDLQVAKAVTRRLEYERKAGSRIDSPLLDTHQSTEQENIW